MMKRLADALLTDSRIRLLIMSCGTFFLFGTLILQFYKLQLQEGEYWQKKAKGLHEFVVEEGFRRGTFYSNTSIKQGHPQTPQPFAIDVEKFHLYIDPQSLPQEKKMLIAQKLFELSRIPSEQKNDFFHHFDKQSRSRKVASYLSRPIKDELMEWWLSFAKHEKIASNAIYFVHDYQRSYPFGKLLGQVLHTIRERKDESTKQAVPTGGLEYYFNDYLKGEFGLRKLSRSLRKPLEKGAWIRMPVDGANIELTINHYLQAIAEEELAKGVVKAHAKGGWLVMMDPNNGHILAMAQYPFFDPTNYQKYFNDPLLLPHTHIRAISDAIEPGSVMKPLIMTLALAANEELVQSGKKPLFDPHAKEDTSTKRFGGLLMKDTHFHHYLNMYLALQKSSNVYVGKLAQRIESELGSQWYCKKLRELFGFGVPTKIELSSENYGFVPSPGKTYSSGLLEWSAPTPYSITIGHNLQMNTVQIARAYSILANGGYLVEPTLVRRIFRNQPDGTTDVIVDHTQSTNKTRVISEASTKEIIKALKYVTKQGGTASSANVSAYTEGGKSGTSEKVINGRYSQELYFALFSGLIPASSPRLVITIVIDEPARIYTASLSKNWHGGTAAAPIFAPVAKRSLEYLGVTPDDPHGVEQTDPRYDPNRADWYNETKQMLQLYKQWNNP